MQVAAASSQSSACEIARAATIKRDSTLGNQALHLGRADEVVQGNSSHVMRGEMQLATRVADLEIGVVVFDVRYPRNGIDEGHGVMEIGKTELLVDTQSVGGQLPARHDGKCRADLPLVQRVFLALARNAARVFEFGSCKSSRQYRRGQRAWPRKAGCGAGGLSRVNKGLKWSCFDSGSINNDRTE